MFKLPTALNAWNTDSFTAVLTNEICSLDPTVLPLQQGLSHSSYAEGKNLSVSILNIDSNDEFIFAKTGLFYTGIIAGCNCADDPTPVDEINEYCEAIFTINKLTAETIVSLIA